jgi:hypothetical protein
VGAQLQGFERPAALGRSSMVPGVRPCQLRRLLPCGFERAAASGALPLGHSGRRVAVLCFPLVSAGEYPSIDPDDGSSIAVAKRIVAVLGETSSAGCRLLPSWC